MSLYCIPPLTDAQAEDRFRQALSVYVKEPTMTDLEELARRKHSGKLSLCVKSLVEEAVR